MSQYYAIVEKNLVTNVIVADEAFVAIYEQNNRHQKCIAYDEYNEDDTVVARIGEGYIGGKFVNGNQAVELGLLSVEEAKAFGFHSGQEYKELQSLVPASITMRQARLILIQYGLDTAVENAINAITDDTQRKIAQTEWEYAAEVYRYNGWVEQLAPALNLTSKQLDALFIEGAKL